MGHICDQQILGFSRILKTAENPNSDDKKPILLLQDGGYANKVCVRTELFVRLREAIHARLSQAEPSVL
jgi:hypothetical protein